MLAGVGALRSATDHWQAFTAEQARRVAARENPRPIPAVTLEDSQGKIFNLADTRGSIRLVTFIYTHCSDVCPTLGVRYKVMRGALRDHPVIDDIVFLSISFDVERDSPERLHAYAATFGAGDRQWRVARPTRRDGLQALLRRFGVVVIPRGEEFVHNAAIHVVNRQGLISRIFDLDETDALIDYLRTLQ